MGRRNTLDDSIICSSERVLLDMSYVYIFIDGNAGSMINLNYSTYMSSLQRLLIQLKLQK